MNTEEVLEEIIKREVVTYIIDGRTKGDISKTLINKFGVSVRQSFRLVDEVKDFLKNFSGENFEEIILTHLSRYEYIYKRAIELGLRSIARASLKGKEKLLNLHKEVASIHINNIYSEGEDSPYDFSRLTPEELKRFDELTSKVLQIKTS